MFQAAALGPEGWLGALRTLAEATGSARAQLIGLGGNDAVAFNWVNDYSPSQFEDFVRLDLASPQVNFRTNAAAHHDGSDIVLHEGHYRAAKARLTSDIYLDFCSDLDMPNGCQTNLIEDGKALVGLALLRTKANGKSTAAQRREFARAAEAARTSVRLQQALEQQGQALLLGTLEAMSAPCLLINGHGQVSAMTPSAEQTLASNNDLLLRDQMLTSNDASLARDLTLALRDAIVMRRPARVQIGLTRRLDLFPLERREWSLSFAPSVVAVFRDSAAAFGSAVIVATERFGLSAAEAAVAELLVTGLSRREIAARRGVTEETLRSQLKAVYAKTGCSREAEVISLLAQLI